MDLNQKIKEQSKIVEGLITKLDNLILEQEEGTTTTPDVVTTESIDIGSSKGFKSIYNKKNQILTIEGKDNKIFIKNGLKDVNLSFTLPKPIDELKYEFTPVETKQKSSKTGDVETLKNIVLQIANIKEVD